MIILERPVRRLTPLVAILRACKGLNLDTGGWVAGGAARAVFEDQGLDKHSDIDFFFADCAQFNTTRDALGETMTTSRRDVTKIGTENWTGTFDLLHKSGTFKVQLVRSAYHQTTRKLFETIDFTVAQFATDGHTIRYTDRAEIDLKNRVLNVEHEYTKLVTRPQRLMKYIGKGFSPAPGVVGWALALDDKKTVVNDKLEVSHVY